MSARPPMRPPELPTAPTFKNRTELQRAVSNVFNDLAASVEQNIGTAEQGIVCVPMIYFVAHLDTDTPEVNKEYSFIRRPDTPMGYLAITNKVIMKDPTFLSAITHSFAEVLANFFNGVGNAVKQAEPESVPETQDDVETAVADADEDSASTDRSNVLPFRLKKKEPLKVN